LPRRDRAPLTSWPWSAGSPRSLPVDRRGFALQGSGVGPPHGPGIETPPGDVLVDKAHLVLVNAPGFCQGTETGVHARAIWAFAVIVVDDRNLRVPVLPRMGRHATSMGALDPWRRSKVSSLASLELSVAIRKSNCGFFPPWTDGDRKRVVAGNRLGRRPRSKHVVGLGDIELGTNHDLKWRS